jgi:hypothetical protein
MHKRLREFEEIRKKLREFEEVEISRYSCRCDCEKQGGNLLRLLSGFRPRIRPLVSQNNCKMYTVHTQNYVGSGTCMNDLYVFFIHSCITFLPMSYKNYPKYRKLYRGLNRK